MGMIDSVGSTASRAYQAVEDTVTEVADEVSEVAKPVTDEVFGHSGVSQFDPTPSSTRVASADGSDATVKFYEFSPLSLHARRKARRERRARDQALQGPEERTRRTR